MQTEYDALIKNNTWSLDSNPIGCKWVFRVKEKEGHAGGDGLECECDAETPLLS